MNYDYLLVSDQGRQIIIGIILIIIMSVLTIKFIQKLIWFVIKSMIKQALKTKENVYVDLLYSYFKRSYQTKILKNKEDIKPSVPDSERRQTIVEDIVDFL